VIVYAATKQQFLKDNDNDDIEEVILRHYKDATGKNVGSSEIRSWQGSLTYMAKVLRDEGLPSDAGLAIELHIPQSSKRIDFLLTGRDENQAKKAVLIELKLPVPKPVPWRSWLAAKRPTCSVHGQCCRCLVSG